MPPKATPTQQPGHTYLTFRVRTGPAITRRSRTRIETGSFRWTTSPLPTTLTQAVLRRLQRTIKCHIVDQRTNNNDGSTESRFTGISTIEGRVDTATRAVSYTSIQNSDTLTLAYLISEGGREYFVASPPIKHSSRRRVHLVIGKHDGHVYVRKLIRSIQRPTEDTLWPTMMGAPINTMHANNTPMAPAAANFVSCTYLGVKPGEPNSRHFWSIISEWQEGVTLDRLNLYREQNLGRPHHRAAVYQLTADLLRAVSMLQAEWKIHQDLTPKNVFISQQNDEMPSATLIDFGTMRVVSHPPNPSIPRYQNITGRSDYRGVLTCFANMLMVGHGLQAGVDTPKLIGTHWHNRLLTFQHVVDSANDLTNWTRWINIFQRAANSRGAQTLRPGRLLPPPGDALSQEEQPAQPLAFAKKDSYTGQSHAFVQVQPIATIGPHQKVWVGRDLPWDTQEVHTALGW